LAHLLVDCDSALSEDHLADHPVSNLVEICLDLLEDRLAKGRQEGRFVMGRFVMGRLVMGRQEGRLVMGRLVMGRQEGRFVMGRLVMGRLVMGRLVMDRLEGHLLAVPEQAILALHLRILHRSAGILYRFLLPDHHRFHRQTSPLRLPLLIGSLSRHLLSDTD
jgi:hypothetical protein